MMGAKDQSSSGRQVENMPVKNQDLHGSAPDSSAVALLLIDFINDLEFEGGEKILERAVAAASRAAELKRRAKSCGVPAIYVNDNFGRWQSNFNNLIEHCLRDGVRGRPLVQRLLPEPDDYFVLKPKHSGFFSTTLDVLLDYLHARTLVLTGIATNVCVLFTANDAYMRDFHLAVPQDCVAALTDEEHRWALDQMERILKADTGPSAQLDFERLKLQ
jgi:nicotinamidase-related amidase